MMMIVSLCSGDGRDLLPMLAEVGQETASAILVEQDATLAQHARMAAFKLGLDHVTVLTRDAGKTEHLTFALPVDLLLLCGIFGNISEQDIALTVAASPAMLRPGGTMIWTRGSTEPDLRPTIRQRIANAGLCETVFDSEPEGFGVGMANKPPHPSRDPPLPPRLFTFLR